MTLNPIRYTLTDLSEYTETLPSGYIDMVLSAGPTIPKPTFIRNYWHYMAVMGHGLSNCRIYTKGYLDKVMVSGINQDGERVRVFFQKTYSRGKYARKRKVEKPDIPHYKTLTVERVTE